MATALDKVREAMTSAPVNVEALIESFGIDLVRQAQLDPAISGEIACLEPGQYRISANKLDHYFRRRFTMAHELGHFLYHRDLIGSGVDDDRAYRSTDRGTFFNKNITPAHEAQANRFAANLLMPAELVTEYFRENNDVSALATKFQVSKEVMRIRLEGLGLL